MEQKDYRLAAIMYTDIVGFSRMMEQNESGTLELLRLHNRIVTDIAARRHGTVIKTIGDAFLVDFRNTVEALQCAMEIQDAVYAHNKTEGAQLLLMRIGVHLGDIYFFENDALGEGINIASRLQSLAKPGCICFSQDVYNQVLNKIDFQAEKLGKVSLKNITKEIHAYEIASPNIEFDLDHAKPRAGFKPGIVEADPALAKAGASGYMDSSEPAKPAAESAKPAPGSGNIIEEIRKAILEDTRAMGRRMTVDEALARYGDLGVEASEVIAGLAEQNILVRRQYGAAGSQAAPGSSDMARSIGKGVEEILRAIETGVNAFQESSRNGGQQRHGSPGRQDRVERALARVERAVGGVSVRISEKQAIKDELKRHSQQVATGKWDAELKDSEYFKPGAEEIETDFDRYRDKVEDKARKTNAGFFGNFFSFLGVNALLWFINLQTSQGFLWAAIVSAAWGTGIASNFAALLRGKAKIRELERMPELDSGALDTYKRLNRVKDSMAMHAASVLSVPVLLFTINLLTSPGFLWAVIPSGIMALSFLGHLASFPVTVRGLEKKLFRLLGVESWRELFSFGKNRRAAGKAAGAYAHIFAEAAAARDDIVKAIRAGKTDDEFGKEMIPTLDRYVDQVKMLTHSVNEIDSIVSSIPMADLAKDREALNARMGGDISPALKDEYRRSIAEIEKQEKACKDLQDQREVLRLRLGSSVNALKQLKIDMARLKALPEASEQQAISDIRKKAAELTGYLDDLKVGYEESVKDPFEELERLAAEADERKRLDAGHQAVMPTVPESPKAAAGPEPVTPAAGPTPDR